MNAVEKHLYEKGYNDGLEEAAILVGSEVVWTPDHIVLLIQKIRALKDNS
jgi:hypothetical protein